MVRLRSPSILSAVEGLMRPHLRFFLSLLIISTLFLPAKAASEESVKIFLISSSGCHACHKVKQEVLPRIEEKYKEKISIEELDRNKSENYLRLLELQDEYNWHPKKIEVPTILIDGKFLVGLGDIDKYLEMYIDLALSSVPVPLDRNPPEAPALLRDKHPSKAAPDVELSTDPVSRFNLIRPLGVITAGLIDGINPCAFTVIIFFISFLALQGYGKREILVIGLSFILAVFIIYVLIGLGLFSFLFQLKTYWLAVKLVYVAGAGLCFILACLAFYDFLKFRRTGQTQGLVLQLPPKLKQRIHRIIGLYYRKGKDESSEQGKSSVLRLIFSAFIVGCFISLFEAVCTGQVYLPTIVFVLKTTPLKLKAFSYLLVYNLMFILPLWLILLFALWGVTSQQFGKLAQKHIGTIKILMVALFLGLGLFLIWQ